MADKPSIYQAIKEIKNNISNLTEKGINLVGPAGGILLGEYPEPSGLNGNIDLYGSLRIQEGALNTDYALDVNSSMPSRLQGDLIVSGNQTILGTLVANTIEGDQTILGDQIVSGNLYVSGNIFLGDNSSQDIVTVNAANNIAGNLTVTGSTKLKNGLEVTGSTKLNSTLEAAGLSTLKSGLNVSGAINTLVTNGYSAIFEGPVDQYYGGVQLKKTGGSTAWNLAIKGNPSVWDSSIPVGSFVIDRANVNPRFSITPSGNVSIGENKGQDLHKLSLFDNSQKLNLGCESNGPYIDADLSSTSNFLQIKIDGNVKLTVNAAGDVNPVSGNSIGLGNSSNYWKEIHSNNLYIKNNALIDNALILRSGPSNTEILHLYNGENGSEGIEYKSIANKPHIFSVNNGLDLEQKLQISSAGVMIGKNNSNLYDYEEGNWTPELSGSSVAVTAQDGYYVKINNLILIHGKINFNTGTINAGTLIKNLPVYSVSTQSHASVTALSSTATNLLIPSHVYQHPSLNIPLIALFSGGSDINRIYFFGIYKTS